MCQAKSTRRFRRWRAIGKERLAPPEAPCATGRCSAAHGRAPVKIPAACDRHGSVHDERRYPSAPAYKDCEGNGTASTAESTVPIGLHSVSIAYSSRPIKGATGDGSLAFSSQTTHAVTLGRCRGSSDRNIQYVLRRGQVARSAGHKASASTP